MKPLLIAAAILALAACKKDAPATQTPPGNTDPGAGSGTAAASGPGSCTTDEDCVVTCARPRECCDQLCPPCEQVMTRDELMTVERWREEQCGATECPMAKCMAPTEETFARCEQGTCTLDRRPR